LTTQAGRENMMAEIARMENIDNTVAEFLLRFFNIKFYLA
jgi:hypothetical protein